MQCPSCGYENVSGAERCASCGRPLPQTVGQGYGFPSSGEPPMPPGGPYQPPTSTPQQPFTSPGAPYGEMPGQPNTTPPGYGMPTPQPGYGAPTPPSGYGTPAPPSGYGAPYPGYGQAAPPSYPMQPGQPGWQYRPGYGPGGQPPQPPQRRSRTGLIVGIIVAVVVVLVACSVGGLVLLSQAGSSITSTTSTVATATPSKTIVYQNDFSSQADDWPSDANCSLQSDGYHIKNGFICYAPPDNQADIDVTVTVKQVSGTLANGHGIVIRRTSQGNLYDFDIYADHGWAFFKCVSSNCTNLTGEDSNSSIHTGLNTTNTIEVVAKGSHFDFFVNGTKVGQTDDTTYASGLVGLDAGNNTDCVFTNFAMAKSA